MQSTGSADFLQAEIDRAIREIRGAISSFAQEMRAPSWVLRLGGLLDKVECYVLDEKGESAFELDREGHRVGFRASALADIWTKMGQYLSQIGDPQELVREQQLAVNQFVVHELLHIRQNFPDFATVAAIKGGLPGYGLPLLDIAADTASAWIASLVEIHRLELPDDARLPQLTNALLRAYVIGSAVFDARKTPQKRQRAIGLIISAALVHAKHNGRLNEDRIFEGWSEEKPILSFDLEKQNTFNAFIMDGIPGLLVDTFDQFDRQDLDELWDSVGQGNVRQIFSKVVGFLVALGVVNRD